MIPNPEIGIYGLILLLLVACGGKTYPPVKVVYDPYCNTVSPNECCINPNEVEFCGPQVPTN